MASATSRNTTEHSLTDLGALASVALRIYLHAAPVGVGTGFIMNRGSMNLLLTNYHVVSGCDPDTGRPIDGRPRPDRILASVFCQRPGASVSSWWPAVHRLVDDEDRPLWVEHPRDGRAFDVVALPLTVPWEIGRFDLSTPNAPRALLGLGSELFIAGFPLGIAGPGATAIWKTGSVATDLGLPIAGKDYFLIDANTREGMSGAPVFARRMGMYTTENGASFLNPTAPVQTWPLGVYAGRQSKDSDVTLGRVWRWRGVEEVIEHAYRELESGRIRPQPALLGRFFPESASTIDISNSTIDVMGRRWSVADVLRFHVEADPRLGGSVRHVELTASIMAACDVLPGERIRLSAEEFELVKLLGSLPLPFDSHVPWTALAPLRALILKGG